MKSPLKPCEGCPVRGFTLCPAIARNHRRFCEQHRENPSVWARALRKLAARNEATQVDERTPPPLPSLSRMAGQAMRTGLAVAVHAATTGEVTASEDEQARRWSICRACDHYRVDDVRCGKVDGCGCWLKRKVPLIAASCPIGKWITETSSN